MAGSLAPGLLASSAWSWSVARDCLPAIAQGAVVTLQAVAGGMTLALALGLIWAVALRGAPLLVRAPIEALVEFVRCTPLLVQLYMLHYVLLPALGAPTSWPLLTGVVGLGLHYSCYAAEDLRAGLDGVPPGQWDAARALGFGRWQTYRHVVLPQAIPLALPALGNELIAMFKKTPMLSAITVLEMLARARQYGSEHFTYLEPLTLVGGVYLLFSLACAVPVRWLEREAARRRGATA